MLNESTEMHFFDFCVLFSSFEKGQYKGNTFCLDFFKRRKVEQLFNQIDVSQDHSTAAVTLQAKGIQRITFQVFGLKFLLLSRKKNPLDIFFV